MSDKTPVEYYQYFAVLDYLPLSDTERKIMALVLTFGERKESNGKKNKGLCLSNKAIGEVLNRSGHTIKKAVTSLREKELIHTEKQKSPYRIIRPAKPENYLTSLGGQVDDATLDLFRGLLDQYRYPLLDRYSRSTEVINEIKNNGGLRSVGTAAAEKKPLTERQRQLRDERKIQEQIRREETTGIKRETFKQYQARTRGLI